MLDYQIFTDYTPLNIKPEIVASLQSPAISFMTLSESNKHYVTASSSS